MIAISRRKVVARAGSAGMSGAFCHVREVVLSLLLAAVPFGVCLTNMTQAEELSKSAAPPIEARVRALIPELEAYIQSGMKEFDAPGLAIGIVTGDRLFYARGFGVRSRTSGAPVDSRTVFQIGSVTKGFLAATLAIAVDRGKLHWDDRVVDLDPDFQLKDPWVTREFRVFDLMAQRSGLPPYANDIVGILGAGEAAMIRSLRHVEPVSSFRSTFAYTNITHLEAGRIVARLAGEPDWNAVLARELLEPLGMKDSSYSADAIAAAANHAQGYRWTPAGTIEVPFTASPYMFGGAGDINSSVEDMARWVRLLLANGTFEGRRIVSPENLAVTRTARVAMSDKMVYANGWIVTQTPNGNIVWHNGGTDGFGAMIAVSLDKDVGVIVLANEANQGFPDAVGLWTLDRLLDNPVVDHAAAALKTVTAKFADMDRMFARPPNPRPFRPPAPLTGSFVNPSFGKAALRLDGEALVLALEESGCQLKLEPWDGDVFTVRVVPSGRFAALVENLGPRPIGFVQPQIGKEGRLTLLRLSFEDGQAYEFRRE
jgi:CubicO group peptidase (beta-lactamase class C family)